MGLVPGTTNLVYSHHASDPAYGRACSAFDLVRLHWFKDLDENVKPDTPINRLPSNIEMCTVASRDKRVIEEIFSTIAEDFEKDVSDGDSDDVNNPDDVGWKTRISLTNTGRFRESVQNYDLLRKHDPVFRSLYFNIMTMMPELNQDVPWRRVSSMTRAWDDVDTAELRFYLEREYRVKITKELAESLVIAEAGQHRKHPVQDYLRELEWDGTPRVETSLPGAEDTPYNRLVARKVLVGAVARAMEPGVKWDHTLILYGPQGVGKSTWMERMAMVGSPERRSYLYSLGDIRSKDTLMAMNMSWIVTSDEGHTLRKSDNDTLKEFLTRNSDVYRVPYGRATRLHPRQCVIWSTTNDETILRRQEGNRRFLIVRCMRKLDLDTMTPEYVDQLWAEAYALYAAGERLFLTEEEFRQAEKQQQPFLEEDTTAGILQEFLDQLVPLDWWDRSPEERLQWLEDRRSGFEPEGEIQVDRTCTRQLWAEALGQHIPPRRGDLLEIAASLREIGWDTGYGTGKSQGHRRFKGYGPQTSFYRPSGKDLI
jgi:predicted P-loop ATPase